MNALTTKYGSQGLVVLGFPCTQFHYQEPGTEAEILNGVKYVRPGGGFVPNFQMFAKIDVNGEKEAPMYTYLKKHCPPTKNTFQPHMMLMYSPIRSSDIAWNWETFLVNKNGKVVYRAPPSVDPMSWETVIQQEVARPAPDQGAPVGK